MNTDSTALLLIGYQNDYFSPKGALHAVVRESLKETAILDHTLTMVEALADTGVLMVAAPILFTPDYSEVVEPVGILKTIVTKGAFRRGSFGGQTIDELRAHGDRIQEVPGRRGLNAFSNTDLEGLLREREIRDVVVAGVVTSLCVDSTARHAVDLGFRVHLLSDCTSGRTQVEQDFYCNEIFPLYGNVIRATDLVSGLSAKVS